MKNSIPFAITLLSFIAATANANTAGADFELSAGAERDSNLNVVELDKTSHQSDTAALLNAKVDGHWQATPKFNLSGGYAYIAKKYQNNSEYDLAIHQLSADANYDFDIFTLGASHHAVKANLDGKSFLDLQQSSIYISKLINNRIYLRAASNWQQKDFTGLKTRNADNQGFSGDAFCFFNGGKTFISAGVANEKENARAGEFDYRGNSVKARASHKFTAFNKENQLQVGWRYLTRDYSGVTPEIKTQRYDSGHVVDASWEIAATKNISIAANAENGRYHSNLASADYSDSRVSVLLKVKF